MKKAGKATLNDKQDHIQSKLLGTNLDEINIEKFRTSKEKPCDFRIP